MPLRVFAEYLKNRLTDLHQTLSLLRHLYMSSFEIENLGIGHSLLPRVFPRPFTHGGICLPHMGGQVQGDKALMGGTHEGGLVRGDS